MNVDRVDELYKVGEINIFEYQAYYTFMSMQISINFLDNACENVFLEPVATSGEHACSYQIGRISVWAEIKRAINRVNQLLIEGK
jgi:hypothetical protein